MGDAKAPKAFHWESLVNVVTLVLVHLIVEVTLPSKEKWSFALDSVLLKSVQECLLGFAKGLRVHLIVEVALPSK